MDQPHEINWKESKGVLNIVQGTRTHGIFYNAKYDLDLIGFTDSDWAGEWQVTTQIESQNQDMCSCFLKDQ